MDSDRRTRGSDGNFPAIKFLAEIGDFAKRNSYHGVSGGFEFRESGDVPVVFFAFETQVDEDAIFAVARSVGRRLFIRNGNDALPFLTGTFGDELPEPDGKMFERRGREHSGLVAPGERRLRQESRPVKFRGSSIRARSRRKLLAL